LEDAKSARYHEQMPELIHEYMDGGNFDGQTFRGQFPSPASSLINDTTSITLDVEPSKKYLLRIVNVAALFAHTVFIG
jgi:iron transport multicopper oxidase